MSFVRRSTRMRGPQLRAWTEHRDRYLVPIRREDTSTSVAADQRLDPERLFARPGPLIVEVGPGAGEALLAGAERRPEANLLAFEVYQPSLARLVRLLSDAGVTNVRLVEADAVAGLERLLPAGSVAELWTYFPDPWPKARHQKRRLVGAEFADLAATRIEPGGVWRLATDWPDYAEQMRRVLDAHPDFTALPTELVADQTDVRGDRPVTRFEQRGLDAGRTISDLGYRRR